MVVSKIIKKIIDLDVSKDGRYLGTTYYNPITKRWEDIAPRREAWRTKHPGKRGPMKYRIGKV